MNPLINFMAKQANGANPMANILSQFSEFKKNWTPETASAKVNELLRTGKINAQQYEQARQMAEKFKGILK